MESQGPNIKKLRIKRDILLGHEIYYSEAFKALGASAMRTFLRCLQKRTWVTYPKKKTRTVFNDDVFSFPYTEARYLGIRDTQFYLNMNRLIEVGLLDLVHQGGAYAQDYSRYRLSERWRAYGTPSFKEGVKPRSLPRGHDIQSNIKRKTKAPSLS